MLKCIPIPSSAALLEAYRRRPPECHEHNKHRASQRSNPGGFATSRRTTPFVLIATYQHGLQGTEFQRRLLRPEMQNGEPEAAPRLLSP
jgi:hypothetical protein